MKRIKVMVTTLLVAVVGSLVLTSSVFAATTKQEPSIRIENDSYDCKIVRDKTYIPMRKVFERLGFEVIWNADTKTVQLKKDGKEVLSLDVEKSEVSGVTYKVLDNKVLVLDSQTMLPIRELLEMLGYNVEWVAESKEIIVSDEAELVEATQTITEAKEENKVVIINGVEYDEGDEEAIRQALLRSILETKDK